MVSRTKLSRAVFAGAILAGAIGVGSVSVSTADHQAETIEQAQEPRLARARLVRLDEPETQEKRANTSVRALSFSRWPLLAALLGGSVVLWVSARRRRRFDPV